MDKAQLLFHLSLIRAESCVLFIHLFFFFFRYDESEQGFNTQHVWMKAISFWIARRCRAKHRELCLIYSSSLSRLLLHREHCVGERGRGRGGREGGGNDARRGKREEDSQNKRERHMERKKGKCYVWTLMTGGMTRVGFDADPPLEIQRANYWPQNYWSPQPSLLWVIAFSPESQLNCS